MANDQKSSVYTSSSVTSLHVHGGVAVGYNEDFCHNRVPTALGVLQLNGQHSRFQSRCLYVTTTLYARVYIYISLS